MRSLGHLFLLVCLFAMPLYPQAAQNRAGSDQKSQPPSSGVVHQVPMTVTTAFSSSQSKAACRSLGLDYQWCGRSPSRQQEARYKCAN